jgi:LysM repeat protein
MSPVYAAVPATPAMAHPQTAVVQKSKPAPHGWIVHVVRSGDTVRDIALRYHTTNSVIVAKNRLKGSGGIIRIGQRLAVPRTPAMAAADAKRAKAAKAKAAAARAAAIRRSTYIVRSGDTLGSIAARRGVSLASLLKTNRLRATSVIHPGQRLRVPGSPAATASAARASSKGSTGGSTTTYRVRSGDTLSHIATRTKTPLSTLLRLNRLSVTTVIHPNQRLKVRGTAPKAKAAAARAATMSYTVRSGDTLGAIAARLGTTQAALAKSNRLGNPNHLTVGQKLSVPVKKAKKATSANTFAGRTYPAHIVEAADRNRAHLRRVGVPSRATTQQMIVNTARRHGVDPKLALAISWQESGWNQSQVSVANAIGAMQVIPSSGQWASDMVGRRLDLLKPQDNITAGVVILRSLSRSAKNLDQAIAGYYQGLYSVQKNGMYADTKRYVANIKAHRSRM